MVNTARQRKVYASGWTDLNVGEKLLMTKNVQTGPRSREKYLPYWRGGTDKIMTVKS